jgi:hypothetical protein
VQAETSKEPPETGVKTIKIKAGKHPEPNEGRIQNEKCILQKEKNHYSRIFFATSGAGFSKLQMSAKAQPSRPLLNQLR